MLAWSKWVSLMKKSVITLPIMQDICHTSNRRVLLSKSRSKKVVRRPGRPQILGPALVQTPPALLPSLPPATTGLTVEPSPLPQRNKCPRCGTLNASERPTCVICDLDLRELVRAGRPAWWLPPDSKVRRCALLIMAMRLAGMEDGEIAKGLQISPKSISGYIYRAGKNGWLNLDAPRERLEYQMTNKALDNLEVMLDDNTMLPPGAKIVKHEATHRLLEGTLYKQFSEPAPQQIQQTIVAVRVEMPSGPAPSIREDTTGGTPAFLEGDIER